MSAAGIDLYPVTDRWRQGGRPQHGAVLPAAQRAAILADPGFGRYFTDHMVRADWSADGGWGEPELVGLRPAADLDPDSMFIHYGQSIFEGLKAYRHPDGSLNAFRPEANAARFARSARRLAMAELPEDLFLGSVEALVRADAAWVADDPEKTLYLRPFEFATEVGLGVRPANAYTYLLVASPAGAYFPRGVKPVSVWLSTEFVRAAPGGTGEAKCSGNYAASLDRPGARRRAGLRPGRLARRDRAPLGRGDGRDEPRLRLRPRRRRATGHSGAHRHAAAGRHPRLAADARAAPGHPAEEERISVEEWQAGNASGEISEVFACGTAAVVTPVGSVQVRDRRVDGRRRPARPGHHAAAPRPARHPDRPCRGPVRLDPPRSAEAGSAGARRAWAEGAGSRSPRRAWHDAAMTASAIIIGKRADV